MTTSLRAFVCMHPIVSSFFWAKQEKSVVNIPCQKQEVRSHRCGNKGLSLAHKRGFLRAGRATVRIVVLKSTFLTGETEKCDDGKRSNKRNETTQGLWVLAEFHQ